MPDTGSDTSSPATSREPTDAGERETVQAEISFGTAVLFAKSVKEVEQVATRLLYRVLRGRGRGDL